MKSSSFVIAASVVALSTAAVALPTFVSPFQSNYKVKATAALGKAGCAACHVGTTSKLNSYGTDLKGALAGKKTLDVAALKKVEALDSDKDGVKNGAEIKKGTLPGDPKSK